MVPCQEYFLARAYQRNRELGYVPIGPLGGSSSLGRCLGSLLAGHHLPESDLAHFMPEVTDVRRHLTAWSTPVICTILLRCQSLDHQDFQQAGESNPKVNPCSERGLGDDCPSDGLADSDSLLERVPLSGPRR